MGGSAIYFDGDPGEYIHPGQALVTQGVWQTESTSYEVRVDVQPSSNQQGAWWRLIFSTETLNQPIAVGYYANAERWQFASGGHPGLAVTGDARGCSQLWGTFVVHEMQVVGGRLRFTATFVQYCDQQVKALRGCVHVE